MERPNQKMKRIAIVEIIFFSVLAILLFALINSCNGQSAKHGADKNINTGITTEYHIISFEKTYLIMNDEVLNHTDIPLGESFYLVHDGIKGFVQKEGKISMGCSLLISDMQGKVLLHNKDLYEGNDMYEKDSIEFIRCTIGTGSPMQYEEKYNIQVAFWDKYGEGKIENNFTIRCIDIP